MTLTELLQVAAVVLTLVGLVVGGTAYALATFRKNRVAAANEATELWRSEYDAVTARQERLERDLRTEREARAKLEGKLVEITRHSEELRQLVMLERIPKALDDALTGTTNRVIARVADAEDRIAEGILTMSDAITKAIQRLHEQQMSWADDLMKTQPSSRPE